MTEENAKVTDHAKVELVGPNDKENKNKVTSYACLGCHKLSTIGEYEANEYKCPNCGEELPDVYPESIIITARYENPNEEKETEGDSGRDSQEQGRQEPAS